MNSIGGIDVIEIDFKSSAIIIELHYWIRNFYHSLFSSSDMNRREGKGTERISSGDDAHQMIQMNDRRVEQTNVHTQTQT